MRQRVVSWLRRRLVPGEPAPATGSVDFGDLRRLTPISRHFGYDRGAPVDRYYIENFLRQHAADIRGRVLEIGDASYTRRFGGEHVMKAEVMHIDDPDADYVGDLTNADHLPSDHFDCFVLTQTLHLIYDISTAVRTVCRILKPGGVVLATAPGISQLSVDEWARYWAWSFTPLSLQNLFADVFPAEQLEITQYGNVLSSVAFLHGLASSELSREELDRNDPCYPLLMTIRAVKPTNNRT